MLAHAVAEDQRGRSISGVNVSPAMFAIQSSHEPSSVVSHTPQARAPESPRAA